MLKKKIVSLNIREIEDGDIRDKKEKALMDFITCWEEHDSILLTKDYFRSMDELYGIAQEQLEWLERVNA